MSAPLFAAALLVASLSPATQVAEAGRAREVATQVGTAAPVADAAASTTESGTASGTLAEVVEGADGGSPSSASSAEPMPEAAQAADVVARRVRTILRGPADPEAWQGLAGVLPQMIMNEGSDVAGIFEAARLADELSGADLAGLGARSPEAEVAGMVNEAAWSDSPGTYPASTPTMAEAAGAGLTVPRVAVWERLSALVGRARSVSFAVLSSLKVPELNMSETELRFAIWAVIAVLTTLIVPHVMRARTPHRPASDGSPVRVRLTAARSLAGQGRSLTEIAQETRLAREPLRVLLGREK